MKITPSALRSCIQLSMVPVISVFTPDISVPVPEKAFSISAAEPPPPAATPSAPSKPAAKDAKEDSAHAAPASPPAGGAHLTQLFDRVNQLLGPTQAEEAQKYQPPEPQSIAETNLTNEDVEKLIYKFLLGRGSAAT